jgi:hypothetical protein
MKSHVVYVAVQVHGMGSAPSQQGNSSSHIIALSQFDVLWFCFSLFGYIRTDQLCLGKCNYISSILKTNQWLLPL